MSKKMKMITIVAFLQKTYLVIPLAPIFGENYLTSDDPVWISFLWFLEDAGGRDVDDPQSGYDDLPDQDPSDPSNGMDPEDSNTSREREAEDAQPEDPPNEQILNALTPRTGLLDELN